jgi:hypothetical protein
MQDRVKLIYHNGKKIVHVNYSGLSNRNEKEFIDAIDFATQFMLRQGKDLLILSDFRDSTGNNAVYDKLKQASAKVKPYRKKSAVIGVSGVKTIFLKGVNLFSKSALMPFSELEEAKNWLVKD